MLILKRNFILHVLNVVKCTLKSGTGTQSYKGGWVNNRPISVMFFVWTLYLMLTATSDIKCSSTSSTVFPRVTPESPTVACLLEPATFRPCTWFPYIHFHVKENSKRNHMAAKLANHLSGNLTFDVGSRADNWLQSTQSALRCQHRMSNRPQTLTGYTGSQTHDD